MKEKSFCFVVVKFQLIFGHPCTSVVCACIDFILVTSLRGADFRSCFIRERLMIYRVVSNDIREKSVAYRTKRTGPSTEPWGAPYMSCDGDEDELLTEVDWYLSERYEWNHWSAVDWMPKKRIWWSIVSKAAERSNKRRTEMLSLSRAERISIVTRVTYLVETRVTHSQVQRWLAVVELSQRMNRTML